MMRSSTWMLLLAGLLVPGPRASGDRVTHITQHSITWTFDRPVEGGRFANGDWWVVGPVTIVSINPPSREVNGRTMHGSVINPSPRQGWSQGYDSQMYFKEYQTSRTYDAALNETLNLSSSNPLVLLPNQSLVSTISTPAPNQRPQLDTAAVLTCLRDPAPYESLRPPYCGLDKTVKFNKRQLDYTKLARLEPVGSPPALRDIERRFERPWIDHAPGWINLFMHPRRNMAEYGREFTRDVSIASLMLHLDFTDAQKETLLVRLVQLGIDSYGVFQEGGQHNWIRDGSYSMGRKWPILFAGIMLDDPEMKSFGHTPAFHQCEDSMTFFVEETSPNVFNGGHGGYTARHFGMPEFGVNHYFAPAQDNVDWFADPNRFCCTALSWWGEILGARIMEAEALWNHDATFLYLDRYHQENELLLAEGRIRPEQITSDPWIYEMYKAYRDDFGTALNYSGLLVFAKEKDPQLAAAPAVPTALDIALGGGADDEPAGGLEVREDVPLLIGEILRSRRSDRLRDPFRGR